MDQLEDVSPTLAARRLGVTLRALRKRMSSLRVADIAKAAGVSQPTWSQVETASALPTEQHLIGAMNALELDEHSQQELLALRKLAMKIEWWHSFSDIASPALLKLIGYEASATKIRHCSSGWIPGLLQTPEWARAGIALPGAQTRPENVPRAVDLRIKRQGTLERPDFQLHAICGEEALRYQAGGRETQLGQLVHLRRVLSAHPRHVLQVVPFSAPLHLGHSGPYTILDFKDPRDTPLLQVEHGANAVFDDDPKAVRRWSFVFEELVKIALSPEATLKLIDEIIEEMK